MKQNTLFRKYRPLVFDDVVGQDAIITTLKNQILNNKIGHAYLFCGTRGTGKTTVAKIFARAINCENKKDSNPCNSCESCVSSIEGSNLNIYEMDAATNNSVEDIRSIKETISFPPLNNEKYKVFIIDEAQELSDSARDAFLKTLEEPPEYVVFILATTEPNKFKQTILSRCQRYDFRRIGIQEIKENLKKICEKENIKITDDALYFIADRGDGSMRDAISILDRCRAYIIEEEIDLKNVKDILGTANDEVFHDITKAIEESDIKKVLLKINETINEGKEINAFLCDYILFIRDLLIVKNLDAPEENLGITKEKYEKIKNFSKNIPKETIIWYIKRLSECLNNIKNVENKKVLLETCLIRLATPENDYIEEAVMSRIANIEEKINSNTYVKVVEGENVDKKEKANETLPKEDNIIKVSKATYEELNKIIENWLLIISDFTRLEKAILKRCKILPISKEAPGIIEIATNDFATYDILKKNDIAKRIENKIKTTIEKTVQVRISIAENVNEKEDVKIEIDELLGKDVVIEKE